jgi:hypothetical protein
MGMVGLLIFRSEFCTGTFAQQQSGSQITWMKTCKNGTDCTEDCSSNINTMSKEIKL